jgi:phosphoserine phosphatase RsbU/P
MVILVAEDDPVSRAVICRSLLQLGHEVVEAADGKEAWELWLARRPSIVVSDWQMPGLSGLELCRRLRAQQGRDYVYFMLVTGSEDSVGNRREAAMAGVDDFIPKPPDAATLWMRLRVAERILSYTRQVHRLEEMMPMCSYCKKIRDDQNYWQQLESYLNEHTGAEVSHSVCPDCYKSVVLPELRRLQKKQAGTRARRKKPVARRVTRVRRKR